MKRSTKMKWLLCAFALGLGVQFSESVFARDPGCLISCRNAVRACLMGGGTIDGCFDFYASCVSSC